MPDWAQLREKSRRDSAVIILMQRVPNQFMNARPERRPTTLCSPQGLRVVVQCQGATALPVCGLRGRDVGIGALVLRSDRCNPPRKTTPSAHAETSDSETLFRG